MKYAILNNALAVVDAHDRPILQCTNYNTYELLMWHTPPGHGFEWCMIRNAALFIDKNPPRAADCMRDVLLNLPVRDTPRDNETFLLAAALNDIPPAQIDEIAKATVEAMRGRQP